MKTHSPVKMDFFTEVIWEGGSEEWSISFPISKQACHGGRGVKRKTTTTENLPAVVGDKKEMQVRPLGREDPSGAGNGNPHQYCWGWRSLAGYGPGVLKSQRRAERLAHRVTSNRSPPMVSW